ncbi:MAG: radical SAM family heme chaperone HemW [Firmicutes bacterium]|nr:radical SAM family heme chaperone HemW [Bacillota bacterium]
MESISIYIHIPFCVRKCLYCDFLSSPAENQEMEDYIEALCCEIAEQGSSYVNYTVQTIFIGGGTPSILPGKCIEQILETVFKCYHVGQECEISMEVNPGTVTSDKLISWKRAGINRLSIGLQSAVDKELKLLGRIHTFQDFLNTYGQTVKTGFNNINIDLMSAIPEQSLSSYQYTLERITGLVPPPTHISSYSLIVEEGTPFYENPPELPDEDCEREMYKITGDFLKTMGYQQYEISNYARPGFECRHNQVYWKRGNYVGFGIGAASMVENVRFKNTENLGSYVNYYCGQDAEGQKEKTIRECVQKLSLEEQMEEFMFLGLRMIRGISEESFREQFGKTIEQVYPGIVEDFCKKGLLRRKTDPETGEKRIALTSRGIDVSNLVMAEFLLT